MEPAFSARPGGQQPAAIRGVQQPTLVPQTRPIPEAWQYRAPALKDVEGTGEWVVVVYSSACCIMAIATATAKA